MQQFIYEFSHNKILITGIIAWFIAQFIKFVVDIVKNRRASLYVLLLSTGGMPSSHSAFVASTSTIIGMLEGFDSTLFAVSSVVCFVTMADAAGIRREAGKQAAAINLLFEKLNSQTISLDEKLRELLGHTPFEVFAGALLGILVGIFSAYLR